MAANPPIDDWVLPRILEHRALERPDRPFLQMVGQPPVTFAEIEVRSRRIANGLASLGLRRGDRLLLMLDTSEAFVSTWFAVALLGAVLVPVNTALRGDFLAHVVADSGATLAVVGADHLPAFAAVAPSAPALGTLVLLGEADHPPGLVALRIVTFRQLEEGDTRPVASPSAVSDLAAIMYTSGTTGRSKGVELPYGHLHLNPRVYIDELRLTEDDVLYTCLPLFHANGLLLGVYAALILGCRIVLSPRFSASRWADEIRTSGATVTNLLGAMTDFILKQPAGPRDRDGALRSVVAVPFTPAQADAFERRFGAGMGTLYGSTELNCPIYRPPGLTADDASCGVLVEAWFEARLVDPETDLEVASGEPGELLVRPRAPWTIMTGYHRRPDATLAAWRNLWFHTGDLMRRDERGHFVFLDRLKDCIRRRGENISAAEVEAILEKHPAVAQVAIVGIRSPYDEHEQEVKACIVPDKGFAAEAAEIARYCRDRMPDFARPRFIEFYDALPMTPTQKVAKAELRAHGVREATWVSPDAAGGRGRAA